jgi:hypothetical protein
MSHAQKHAADKKKETKKPKNVNGEEHTMLPRTERCSRDTGLLPLAVNLTFFMCVFMAWSTPVTVPGNMLRTHPSVVGNQTATLHRDVFKEHTVLRHLTLDNAAILELDSNTLLPQLHEKPGVRMSSTYRKGQAQAHGKRHGHAHLMSFIVRVGD